MKTIDSKVSEMNGWGKKQKIKWFPEDKGIRESECGYDQLKQI